MQAMSKGIVRSLGLGNFPDWENLDALGSAMLVAWDKRSLALLDKEVGLFTISCLFRNIDDGFVWIFTSVYVPLTRDGRLLVQDELGVVKGLWEDPWCVRGDFNVIRFPSEHNRLGRLNRSMYRFSEVINDLELVALLGGKYTWSGACRTKIWLV